MIDDGGNMRSVGEQIELFLESHEPLSAEIALIVSDLVAHRGTSTGLPRSDSEDLRDAKLIWAIRNMTP